MNSPATQIVASLLLSGQRSVRQWGAQLRLQAAGLAMLMKLGMLGIVLLSLSSWTVSPHAWRPVRECLDAAAGAAACMAILRVCTLRCRRWLVLSLCLAGIIGVLAATNTWWRYLQSNSDLKSTDTEIQPWYVLTEVLCLMVAAVLSGVLTRPMLYSLAGPRWRGHMRQWIEDGSAAQRTSVLFGRLEQPADFCEACGGELSPAERDLPQRCSACGRVGRAGSRVELESVLWRSEGCCTTVLAIGRLLLLAIVAWVLLAAVESWWEGQWFALHEAAIGLWVVWGILAGVGVALMLLHRGVPWRSVLLGVAVVLLLMGAGSAFVSRASLHMWRDTSDLIAMPVVMCSVAILSGWACLAVSRRLIRWLAPKPLQLHLLPAQEESAAAAGQAAQEHLACEQCGYSLVGLPRTRCDDCGVVQLRCPECGHSQPAGIAYPQLRRTIHRVHIVVRSLTIVVKTGVIALSLLAWFMIFANVPLGEITPSDWKELMLVVGMLTAYLVVPMRMALLRRRPAWLYSALVFALVAGTAAAGRSLYQPSRWTTGPSVADPWKPVAILALAWALWALLTPFVYRVLLHLVLRRPTARALYAWQTSRPLRREPAGSKTMDPAFPVGRQWAAGCRECGAGAPGRELRRCPRCSVASLGCGECGRPQPISATRLTVEEAAGRAKMFVLAMICMAALGAAVIALCFCLGEAENLVAEYSSNRYYGSDTAATLRIRLIDNCATAVAVGMALRLLLVCRGRSLLVAGCIGAGWACVLVCGVCGVTMRHGFSDISAGLLAAQGLCALLGATLAMPLTGLAARLLMPQGYWRPLVDWLTGRQTLETAAEALP